MMEIADLLSIDSVVPNFRATGKKQALQELAGLAAKLTGQDERAIFDVLLERERLGTTGIGNGIAIPHGKLSDLDHLYGLFVRLKQGVPFDAIDDEPVDLIFSFARAGVGGRRSSEGAGPCLAAAARQNDVRQASGLG